MELNFKNFFNNYKQLDYLSVNDISNFDWDDFFKRYHENYIFESIEQPLKIKDEIRKNNVRHIEYTFSINEHQFLSVLDAVPCEVEISSLKEDMVKYQMEKISTKPLEELISLYQHNPDKLVLKYQFRDSTGDTFISNKLGNQAFAVLKVAQKVLLSGLSELNIDNVLCIEFHVAKSESKRLDLYKKLLERTAMGSKFSKSFTDSFADQKYLTHYIWS